MDAQDVYTFVNAPSLIQIFRREMNQIYYSPVARMRRSPVPSLSPEFSFHRLLFVAYPLRWKREKAMKVAKQIALTIPPNVLAQPDRVIK
jgi:hypothetical protein